MLLVETELKESFIVINNKSKSIGLGLFSTKNIGKDSIVYIDEEILSKEYSNSLVEKLDSIQKAFIVKYGTYKRSTDSWYLCLDDSRFWNHSEDPNCRYINNKMIAIKHIYKGEELTCDYREFCDLCKEGSFGFNILG